MTVQEYLENINNDIQQEVRTQSAYRANLEKLLESLTKNTHLSSGPKYTVCGAPDYILEKNGNPKGYILSINIGEKLPQEQSSGKLVHYRNSLPNLIVTNYIDFQFYRRGERVASVSIGNVKNGELQFIPEAAKSFQKMYRTFLAYKAVPVTSSLELARRMARKTRLLADIIVQALESDSVDKHKGRNTLHKQLEAFKNMFDPHLDIREFAENYAQTTAYGMLAARLHDPTLDTFSRQEAAELIPGMHPFLKKLFEYIGNDQIDDRIRWIVDALADMLRLTNVASLLDDFVVSSPQRDPVKKFFETFWQEFDPAFLKTPEVPKSIVNFIVSSADDILKKDFGLIKGLADVSKTKLKLNDDAQNGDEIADQEWHEKEVHKVQILDPSSKTGTFLAEAVKKIYEDFKDQQGVWARYVENHLIPRLNGFEILMASYAMSHLKLDMLLRKTGYKREGNKRFRVFLANFLNDSHADEATKFERWLNEEASEAKNMKHDTPVMVIMGKPPFSNYEVYKEDWIMDLMKDYQVELNSPKRPQKSNFELVEDDYVQFLRYGQYFVEKNGKGLLAFINPDTFLDDPAFRGMRRSLLKTFDKIYTIDLNDNSLIKESDHRDRNKEEFFNISQEVSINFFIKTGKKRDDQLGEIYYYDLPKNGCQTNEFLSQHSITDIEFKQVDKVEPYLFYTEGKYNKFKIYHSGFAISELFNLQVGGINGNKQNHQTLDEYLSFKKESAERKNIEISHATQKTGCHEVLYRPFDIRYAYFKQNTSNEQTISLSDGTKHFVYGENLGLILSKMSNSGANKCVFLTKHLSGDSVFRSSKAHKIFPLYLYSDNLKSESPSDKPKHKINLNRKLVKDIADQVELSYVPTTKEVDKNEFTHLDLLDYIYAVLNSSTYWNRNNEFLKNDFFRVPYPKDQGIFWDLVKLGKKLRKVHLLEHPVLYDFVTTYPVEGSDKITRSLTQQNPGFTSYDIKDDEPTVSGVYARYPNEELGMVRINDTQFFGKVPKKAWNYCLSGYYPARQWLKDRRGTQLSFEDIQHYQKIIMALMETSRIKERINDIELQNLAATQKNADISNL